MPVSWHPHSLFKFNTCKMIYFVTVMVSWFVFLSEVKIKNVSKKNHRKRDLFAEKRGEKVSRQGEKEIYLCI